MQDIPLGIPGKGSPKQFSGTPKTRIDDQNAKYCQYTDARHERPHNGEQGRRNLNKRMQTNRRL